MCSTLYITIEGDAPINVLVNTLTSVAQMKILSEGGRYENIVQHESAVTEAGRAAARRYVRITSSRNSTCHACTFIIVLSSAKRHRLTC